MSHRRSDRQTILVAPEALARLAAGFDQMAAVLALTLGPTQGAILNAQGSRSVEVLSDAGTIARRLVEIPDRGRNAGAMIARHLAWRMHERFGDGAATAAVLARAMVREAVKRIAAGSDPVPIRAGLEHAVGAAVSALAALAEPVAGSEALAAIATGVAGDRALGAVLGEIADLLGPDAALTIEEFPVPYLDREYVEGAYWRAHPADRAMLPEGQAEVVLDRPLIVAVDQKLDEVDDVRPALELAAASPERRPLLIVPAALGDRALAAITVNHARGTVTAIAAILGSNGAALSDDLADLAVLTAGNVVADAIGRSPRRLRPVDLGTARRAIVRRDSLTIIGGAGDPAAIGKRAAALRQRLAGPSPGEDERKRLLGRIARLSGGVAILKLGAHVEAERERRRAQAEKAFRVLTGALADGVVPGGGVAYLACAPAVEAARDACALSGREQGVDVMLTALAAPFRQLVANAGVVHPPLALAEVGRRGYRCGLDVTTGEYVDMREQGIVDSLRVARGALELATSAAISALTTGVVVLPSEARRGHAVKP